MLMTYVRDDSTVSPISIHLDLCDDITLGCLMRDLDSEVFSSLLWTQQTSLESCPVFEVPESTEGLEGMVGSSIAFDMHPVSWKDSVGTVRYEVRYLVEKTVPSLYLFVGIIDTLTGQMYHGASQCGENADSIGWLTDVRLPCVDSYLAIVFGYPLLSGGGKGVPSPACFAREVRPFGERGLYQDSDTSEGSGMSWAAQLS